MSSSRFLLFGSSIFRTHRTLSPIPVIRYTKPLPLQTIRFHKYSSSAALDSIAGDSSESLDSRHPWPEWVTFVDRLKTKGYFMEPPPPPPLPANDEGESGGDVSTSSGAATATDESVYKEMNVLKDACLSFARDRYDIFKSLSRNDVQTVVEGGCPNLFRKAVNSAKRLRAYLRMDEAEVCSACNLRGSCDKAYVILNESEAAARTVDIVRVLLFHALDPLVISGGEKPPGRELIEVSAKKLLSELTELSETSPDPELPKHVAKAPQKKKLPVAFVGDELSQNVEMKRGDWMCPKCNFMNFARNKQCLNCKEDGPKRVSANFEMKKGDWICPECSFTNFSRNVRCLKCKAEGPKRVAVNDVEMKKGDWDCPQCGFMNFASNTKCLRCPQPRPKRQLNPGEWECPSCDFLNYKRNMVCLMCKCIRPKEAATQYEEQIWKKPC
ncbi:hypothetical protein L1049_028140 [Liquidambar formosana]|uniref:RanBP2-type domain-containing protein n=1 Tax=Liquidambar formosana TaxID=63359 RepID=A0AAP0RJS6_LIQFO